MEHTSILAWECMWHAKGGKMWAAPPGRQWDLSVMLQLSWHWSSFLVVLCTTLSMEIDWESLPSKIAKHVPTLSLDSSICNCPLKTSDTYMFWSSYVIGMMERISLKWPWKRVCMYVGSMLHICTSPDRIDTMPPHMNKSAVHSASFERLFRLMSSVPLRKNWSTRKVCAEKTIF